jgi:hypothetical protein
MIRHRPAAEVLEDLRFALEVMEEKTHSGMDAQSAKVLRNRILTQIAKVEAEIAGKQPAIAPPNGLPLELSNKE